jgi:hypothetical protein
MNPSTMYLHSLNLHSWLRLALVVLLLLAFLRATSRWLGRKPWSASDRTLSLWVTILADLQLVLGFLLYFLWSPNARAARDNMSAAMKDPEMRFVAVEHATGMVLAIVIIHVSKVLSRKGRDDATKYRRLAIGFAIALCLILTLSGWPWGPMSVRPLVRGFGG